MEVFDRVVNYTGYESMNTLALIIQANKITRENCGEGLDFGERSWPDGNEEPQSCVIFPLGVVRISINGREGPECFLLWSCDAFTGRSSLC
jgi:hypothetical protein